MAWKAYGRRLSALGAYGKVRMGTHRLTSTRVAIKQIPKSMSTALTREIHHHRQLHHPNIMQMFEVIATESAIWIVTELCYGGELFDYLVEKGRLSEEETRVIFGQLCLAVHYLHEKGIVHRDLKLENVLLDEKCRVKLGDFGFTREYESNVFMETFCGTTGYASPEMLQGKKYCGPGKLSPRVIDFLCRLLTIVLQRSTSGHSESFSIPCSQARYPLTTTTNLKCATKSSRAHTRTRNGFLRVRLTSPILRLSTHIMFLSRCTQPTI